jgi:hypothetical protein
VSDPLKWSRDESAELAVEDEMKIRRIGAEDAFFMDCECCGTEFRCGPNIYDGQNVPGWEVPMCHSCKPPFRSGHEILPTPRLLAALKAKGVSVIVDARGLLRSP